IGKVPLPGFGRSSQGGSPVVNDASGHIHAVVLAGGSGQRFWPLSRELSPKQMLTVFGTESLIAAAVHRVLPLLDDPADGFMIVTNERLFDELRNHLTAQPDPALHDLEYLVEPLPRNTAPAIALACARVVARDPEGVVLVLPSDHLLEYGQTWVDAMRCALALACGGHFATIGIRPTRPETGYGYIRAGAALPDFAVGVAHPHVAAEFVEKPDADTAARYLADGGYMWNAGMFAMRASAYLDELRRHDDTRRIADVAVAVAGCADADPSRCLDPDEARGLFGAVPSVSIDVAVMERCDRVAVVPASIAWSDVGSLAALNDLAPADEHGNVRVGRGVDIDTTGTVVYAAERLVATLGVRDLVVVDTADATLVMHRDAHQDVRRVVAALSAVGAEEVVQPRTSLRPWGSWTTLLESPGYKVKEIHVNPGCRLSLQRHAKRSENWIVVTGRASITCDDELIERGPGESAYIRAGVAHRLANAGDVPLRVIEVSTGDYLGEDDIERLDDDWKRHG
ncbi:MAG TPA: mannose-1-phosphate guanylyltransferase/mannose-6-phosphate isomerase, partial [Coriobacteriia bacterium]